MRTEDSHMILDLERVADSQISSLNWTKMILVHGFLVPLGILNFIYNPIIKMYLKMPTNLFKYELLPFIDNPKHLLVLKVLNHAHNKRFEVLASIAS